MRGLGLAKASLYSYDSPISRRRVPVGFNLRSDLSEIIEPSISISNYERMLLETLYSPQIKPGMTASLLRMALQDISKNVDFEEFD